MLTAYVAPATPSSLPPAGTQHSADDSALSRQAGSGVGRRVWICLSLPFLTLYNVRLGRLAVFMDLLFFHLT